MRWGWRFSIVMRQRWRKGISQKQLSPRAGFTETGSEFTGEDGPAVGRSGFWKGQGCAKKSGNGHSTAGCAWSSQ